MIEVIDAGPLSCVQDLGRHGFGHLGVSSSGAMDTLALRAANLLAGNDEHAAAVEVAIAPFVVRIHAPLRVAVTGAQYRFSLDGRQFPAWWGVAARAGQVLKVLGAPNGGRAYVAFQGGLDVPQVMGSRSTDLKSRLGGLEGRRLVRGDRLVTFTDRVPVGAARLGGFGLQPPEDGVVGDEAAVREVRFVPAAEYAHLTEATRQILHATDWQVSSESNRMGYRFKGPVLTLQKKLEMRSHGIVPGVMQLPPAGNPIVQLCDANTMGGYPKIGVVIRADLRRLAQSQIGARVRFVAVDRDCALQAWSAQQKVFEQWRAAVAWAAGDARPEVGAAARTGMVGQLV